MFKLCSCFDLIIPLVIEVGLENEIKRISENVITYFTRLRIDTFGKKKISEWASHYELTSYCLDCMLEEPCYTNVKYFIDKIVSIRLSAID